MVKNNSVHVYMHVGARLDSLLSCSRLDAGTFGAMGLGAGYAIAASLLEKMKPVKQRCPVLCIQGDSAFGFAGMEFETACR
jgi:oxalyl-CoA decarboxylase